MHQWHRMGKSYCMSESHFKTTYSLPIPIFTHTSTVPLLPSPTPRFWSARSVVGSLFLKYYPSKSNASGLWTIIWKTLFEGVSSFQILKIHLQQNSLEVKNNLKKPSVRGRMTPIVIVVCPVKKEVK